MKLELKILGTSGRLSASIRIGPGVTLRFELGCRTAAAWGRMLAKYAESAERYKREARAACPDMELSDREWGRAPR